MRRFHLLLVLVGLASIALPRAAAAQDKTAEGMVSAVAGDSVTVSVKGADMTFAVDTRTVVVAHGGRSKAAAAQARGESGANLAALVKKGQTVLVTYAVAGAAQRASRIQVVEEPRQRAAAAVPASRATAAPSAKIAYGFVKVLSSTSLTIEDGGKETTFTVSPTTRVVAPGASRKSASAGGRTAITDLVTTGKRVAVSYREADGMKTAASVRVIE